MGVTAYSELREVKSPDEILETYFRREVRGAGIRAFTGLTIKQIHQKIEQDTGLEFDEYGIEKLMERIVEEYPMIEWDYLDKQGNPRVLKLNESFVKYH